MASTKELRQQANETGRNFKSHAGDVGHDIKQLASTAGQAARAQIEPVESFITSRPLTSVLIAAGSGILMGMLLRGRS